MIRSVLKTEVYVVVCQFAVFNIVSALFVENALRNAGVIIRILLCWHFEPLKVGSVPYGLGR